MNWTKLSCRTFKDNQTRLQLFALAYNLANFLGKTVEKWTLRGRDATIDNMRSLEMLQAETKWEM